MPGALADDHHHFAFIVELDRLLRPDQRLLMRRQRGRHAEEDRLEFRDVVLVRTFLDVVEIVEAEADDLAGIGDRQREFQSGQRNARGCRRLLHGLGKRLHVAIGAQERSEFTRQLGVGRLNVDDAVTIDNAHAHAVIGLEIDDLHCLLPRLSCIRPGLIRHGMARLSADGEAAKDGCHRVPLSYRCLSDCETDQGASVKAWIEKYFLSSSHTPAGSQPTPRARAPSDSIEYL